MTFLAAALLLILAPAVQEKSELRWKWKKGEELVYKSQQKTLLELLGQPIEQQMAYTYSMTVSEVSETGEATLQVKYLAVAAKGSSPQGEFDYDSEKDKEAPADGPGALHARMVGQSFTMKMDATGRVTDVKGYDKVVEAMMKGEEPNPQFKQMFSNDSFKGMMQQMAPPLPKAKVGKGDPWETDFVVKMPMIGGMKFTQSSKLSDLKEGNAHIDQDIKVELVKGEPDNPFAGLVELKDAAGKASAVFSVEKGCFLSQKSAMELKIAVQAQEMPMKTVVELKLVSRK
jgi:hypothetical protein